MTRALILGVKGMLGQMVEQILSRSGGIDVEYTCYEQEHTPFYFNVEDGINGLRQIVERCGKFDYFINCIGILNSNIDERNSQSVRRAILVNALFPHELSALAGESGARVIHISSDGVFARNAGICFEDSPSNCDDVYGKTKALGEVIARRFLNLRCSIIGPDLVKKQGLLEWFRNHPLNAEVEGYSDQTWNGVTTLQFAELCRNLILQDSFDAVCAESAVHHFCPNQAVSKYELLQLFKTAFRPDIAVKPATSQSGPVRRILDTRYNSLKDLCGYEKSMQHAIDELAAEMGRKND